MRLRIQSGYQDTRTNNEDIALTPYLFGVYVNESSARIYGIGLCWIHSSIFVGIGINVPKQYPLFKNITRKKQS